MELIDEVMETIREAVMQDDHGAVYQAAMALDMAVADAGDVPPRVFAAIMALLSDRTILNKSWSCAFLQWAQWSWCNFSPEQVSVLIAIITRAYLLTK